jgi:putative ABC transport system permease protein
VGSSVVDVGPRLAVPLVALTALAVAAGRLSVLGLDRCMVVAAGARHRPACWC